MYTSVWDGQILTHATTREGISILVDANNLRDIQKDLAGGVYGCEVRLGPILATGSRLWQALGRLVCQDGHRTLHRILSARKGSSWRRSYFILSPIMEQRTNLGGTGTSLSSCKPISGSLRVYYGGCGSLGILGRLYAAVTSIYWQEFPSLRPWTCDSESYKAINQLEPCPKFRLLPPLPQTSRQSSQLLWKRTTSRQRRI